MARRNKLEVERIEATEDVQAQIVAHREALAALVTRLETAHDAAIIAATLRTEIDRTHSIQYAVNAALAYPYARPPVMMEVA